MQVTSLCVGLLAALAFVMFSLAEVVRACGACACKVDVCGSFAISWVARMTADGAVYLP